MHVTLVISHFVFSVLFWLSHVLCVANMIENVPFCWLMITPISQPLYYYISLLPWTTNIRVWICYHTLYILCNFNRSCKPILQTDFRLLWMLAFITFCHLHATCCNLITCVIWKAQKKVFCNKYTCAECTEHWFESTKILSSFP